MSQSPPRKKHDDGVTKEAGIFSFRFGVNPWQYASVGACRQIDADDQPEEEGGEMEEREEGGSEAEDPGTAPSMKPFRPRSWVAGPQHGDVIDTMGYRGCGLSVLELLNPFTRSFAEHKTWEEYGYTVPPAFSDAPLGYFAHTGATSRLIYVPLALEDGSDTALKATVAAEVEKRRREPSFRSEMTGDTLVVDVTNLQAYCLHFEDGGISSWIPMTDLGRYFDGPPGDDAEHDPLTAGVLRAAARIRTRMAWLRKMQGALVHETFGKHFGLPRDISKMIANLALAAADPEDALLEPFCEYCSYGIHVPLADLIATRCELCQKLYCEEDGSCSVPQHSATHRHLSRMRRV